MNKNDLHIRDREPVVAGRFYPAGREELTKDLDEYFTYADDVHTEIKGKHIRALIAPHAGYMYSGRVAATAYSLISKHEKYKNIFLLGSSHRISFSGASVYNLGNYITPLGKAFVNLEIANKLIDENDSFDFVRSAHSEEHSLEVQLPFLQYAISNDIHIIPIILGTQNSADCKQIANILKPYFTPENLFIISTDFSHYPAYDEAVTVDNLTAQAIISNDPDILLNRLKSNEKLNIRNLATSLCGWTSVLTLMYLTNKSPLKYIAVHYQNSGDAKLFGEKSQVVGYYSIAVVEEDEDISGFKEKKTKKEILNIAKSAIENNISKKKSTEITTDNDLLKQNYGVFVSIYVKEKLRGCIGKLKAEKPLYILIQEMAVAASSMDSRFKPLMHNELEDCRLEISVLSPLKRITSLDELELGKHGIYIKKGLNSGTFLPQVATKTGWDKVQFVGNCAKNKAGIGYDGWYNAELYTYEACVLNE